MNIAHFPPDATPFVGRQDELAEIAQLLANHDCRLLTLAGVGGIGKTRLALEAARSQTSVFKHGVYFISLQPLSSPNAIIPTIAEAIAFQIYTSAEPQQQLLDFMREKSLLLVLDNFEHLLESAPLVGEILSHAPAVKVLITSRERLNLIEEWVLDVRGLSTPPSLSENDVEKYGAVQLFLQHARRVQVGFTLPTVQQSALIRICQLVGGMPLGIELAAAWVRALSCQEIAAEIERSFDILATSARNVSPRHRNMRVVLDHSWALLSAAERDVYMKLSVFKGAFRKEAALYVAGATVQTLSALVDKSLLRVDASGYYEIHELLRQYARGQLDVLSAEREQADNLHSAYYAEFMREREIDLRGSRQGEAFKEIEAEFDNVRAAWEWSLKHANVQHVEKYLWSLMFFFEMRCRFYEGEEAFTDAIRAFEKGMQDKENVRLVAQLYARRAWFSVRLGIYEKARDELYTSLVILRRLECWQEMIFPLIGLGGTATYSGEHADADLFLDEALSLSIEFNQPLEMCLTLLAQLREAAIGKRYDQGKQIAQESIALCRQIGDHGMEASTLNWLGHIFYELRDYEEAKRLLEESVSKALPHLASMTHALVYLGKVAIAMQADDEASDYFHRALQAIKEVGYARLQLEILLYVVPLLLKHGDKTRAVELVAKVTHHPASQRDIRDSAKVLLDQLSTELSAEVFAAHHEKGRQASVDTLIATLYQHPLFARFQTTESVDHQVVAVPRITISSSSRLTEREIEILHLMAQGMSNREIAEKLVLAVGTIKWYISQIYDKLHTQNRVQAIARGHELNLLT